MKRAVKFLIQLAFLTILSSGFLLSYVFADEKIQMIQQLETEEKRVNDDFDISINIDYDAAQLRDPFQSYLKEHKEELPVEENIGPFQLPSLNVQGIIWGSNIPQAIINNKVLKTGDIIDDAKILVINKTGVKMVYKNHEFNIAAPSVISMDNISSKFKGGKNEKQ
jgi:hypothetical protein